MTTAGHIRRSLPADGHSTAVGLFADKFGYLALLLLLGPITDTLQPDTIAQDARRLHHSPATALDPPTPSFSPDDHLGAYRGSQGVVSARGVALVALPLSALCSPRRRVRGIPPVWDRGGGVGDHSPPPTARPTPVAPHHGRLTCSRARGDRDEPPLPCVPAWFSDLGEMRARSPRARARSG